MRHERGRPEIWKARSLPRLAHEAAAEPPAGRDVHAATPIKAHKDDERP